MTSASLDRLLAVLVVLLATTGLLSLRAGSPDQGWVFVVHGVLAGSLTVAVVMKWRASVPRAVVQRRWSRLALGLPLSIAAAAALAGGYLWVAGGQLVWLDVAGLVRWTVLTLHAWIGLVLVPLVLVHLLPRRWRLLRPGPGSMRRATDRLVTRRSVLIGAGLLVAGVALRGLADGVEAIRGGSRRFTGSRWLPAGGIPPPTTFFGEPVPPIDRARWRLRVGSTTFTERDLRALPGRDVTAVLDCTSGWALETTWQGVDLQVVLAAAGIPGNRSVSVRSATGWSTALSGDETGQCLLAWACAGRDLLAGNGAPLRLVAPGHRGLDWVKWVTTIDVA